MERMLTDAEGGGRRVQRLKRKEQDSAGVCAAPPRMAPVRPGHWSTVFLMLPDCWSDRILFGFFNAAFAACCSRRRLLRAAERRVVHHAFGLD